MSSVEVEKMKPEQIEPKVSAEVISSTTTPTTATATTKKEEAEECIVTFQGEKFNVGPFLSKHPAGREIILEQRGKDITAVFREVGHSAAARKLLEKHRVSAAGASSASSLESERAPRGNVVQYLLFARRKLFTSEDPQLLHKTLGLLALASFAHRYLAHWPAHGASLGFSSPSLFNLCSLAVHLLLSTSSLIFHVLRHRLVDQPLIIYEEYRLHAILFSVRSVLVSLVGLFIADDSARIWTQRACLLIVHLLVDLTTHFYGTKGVTAVRNAGDGKFKLLRQGFSFYQFLAIASHLLPAKQSVIGDLGFNTLIAIQSSAFLMTLRRKNVVKWSWYLVWYSLCLFLSVWFMYASGKSALFFLATLAVFLLRVNLGIDKYILWTAFAVFAHFVPLSS